MQTVLNVGVVGPAAFGGGLGGVGEERTGRENCRCRGTSVRDKDQTVGDLWTWSGASSLVLRLGSRPLIREPTREGGLGAAGRRQEADRRQLASASASAPASCCFHMYDGLPRHQRCCHSNALHARCLLCCAVLYVCNPRLDTIDRDGD